MSTSGQVSGGEQTVMNADEAMSQYAQGDDQAFEIIYDAVAPRLEGYLRRRVRDTSRIQDIIQQTFLNICHKRGSFNPGAEVYPWACTIARNFMIDDAKRTQREAPEAPGQDDEVVATWLVSTVANGEEILQAQQTKNRLLDAFSKRSEREREAFTLVKVEGMSHEQAAQVLGTTVMGVKLRVHKVRVALLTILRDGEETVATLSTPPLERVAGRK
jgi:RNA polymerase sigma-70 factor (ECF subfamily)